MLLTISQLASPKGAPESYFKSFFTTFQPIFFFEMSFNQESLFMDRKAASHVQSFACGTESGHVGVAPNLTKLDRRQLLSLQLFFCLNLAMGSKIVEDFAAWDDHTSWDDGLGWS
jgi:hypothetical protein